MICLESDEREQAITFVFTGSQTLFPFTDPKTRQYAVFWPSQGSTVEEDIRKVQDVSTVVPVNPRQFGGDDDSIHCDKEWDLKDKHWFPSNMLKAESAPECHTPEQRGCGVSTSQSQSVSGSQQSFLGSWTSFY